MTNNTTNYPKEPRWISTEAGQWAWREQAAWRTNAMRALSVQDRLHLLHEAERLRESQEVKS